MRIAVVAVVMLVAEVSLQAQGFTVLYRFNGTPDGAAPVGALLKGRFVASSHR